MHQKSQEKSLSGWEILDIVKIVTTSPKLIKESYDRLNQELNSKICDPQYQFKSFKSNTKLVAMVLENDNNVELWHENRIICNLGSGLDITVKRVLERIRKYMKEGNVDVRAEDIRIKSTDQNLKLNCNYPLSNLIPDRQRLQDETLSSIMFVC